MDPFFFAFFFPSILLKAGFFLLMGLRNHQTSTVRVKPPVFLGNSFCVSYPPPLPSVPGSFPFFRGFFANRGYVAAQGMFLPAWLAGTGTISWSFFPSAFFSFFFLCPPSFLLVFGPFWVLSFFFIFSFFFPSFCFFECWFVFLFVSVKAVGHSSRLRRKIKPKKFGVFLGRATNVSFGLPRFFHSPERCPRGGSFDFWE